MSIAEPPTLTPEQAHSLEEIGQTLIAREPDFSHLEQARIVYLWKRKGGNAKGHAKLGQCQKPSGLLLHFADCDFVVWLAADHLRERQYTAKQIEAVVFHELNHAGYEEDEETGAGKYVIVGHDAEVFYSEITRYGTYKEDLQLLAGVFRQLSLDEAR